MPPTATKSEADAAPAKPVTTKAPDIASASVPDTLAALHVNPDTGLTHAEVDASRKEHGYNEVAVRKEHPVLQFLRKFWGISAWMLELIMILSAVLRKFSDLAVVGALLVINAVLSFMQEQRAAGVVETLRRKLQVSARVRRDSNWQVIPARELVPGDIVRVRPGDIVPADVKLLTGGLTADESALTGESKDVDKAPGTVLSSGSVARRGEGNGVVMLTGAKTYFGRTTELVQEARPKLHIEAVVSKVVRWLFVIVGALIGVVVVVSLIRGAPLLEMVPLMLVLLMSAVPVALPVMFTVSMAVGSKELAKRGVLVTRLSASEDAATMNVLCVDKTGTITMNQLAVTGVIPLEHATVADSIAPQDLEEHLSATAEGSSWAPATVNRYRALISLVYRLGIESGKVKQNPARLVKHRQENNARIRWLSAEEEVRLRAAISATCPEHMPELDLALNTGLRLGELYGLEWENVNLARRVLTVPRAKNGEMRHVPLNGSALAALAEADKQSDGTGPVIRNAEGGALTGPRYWFEPAVKQAKLRSFSWHCLRHTFASRLVMAGVDLRTVQELMGHKSIQMTVRYSHLTPRHTLAAVEKLIGSISAGPTDTRTSTGPEALISLERSNIH
jgi:magnesium-transporting ATPase (P-type)